jgi:hypothetical protein
MQSRQKKFQETVIELSAFLSDNWTGILALKLLICINLLSGLRIHLAGH